ncbi:hypothetical protein OAF54_02775 [bacterium]|nr:hypothetical protein [bacterium]
MKKPLANKIKDVEDDMNHLKEKIGDEVLAVVQRNMLENGLHKWGIQLHTVLTSSDDPDTCSVYAIRAEFHR